MHIKLPHSRLIRGIALAAIISLSGLALGAGFSACAHENSNSKGPLGAPPEGGPGGPPPDGAMGGPGGPGGTPPEGGPGGASGGPGVPGGKSSPANILASFTVAQGDLSETGKTYAASAKDTSAVLVTKGAKLQLTDAVITKTGATSSEENSNFAGQNAAILASEGAHVVLKNVKVTSNGDGANGVFATGAKTVIDIDGITINTSANSSRGLDATYGGTINASNVTITTKGAHCGGLATDRGEGNINVTKAVVNTSGEGSPAIYCTGAFVVKDSELHASGSEGAVIEGKNSIDLSNCTVSGAKIAGVMLYQSFSGDAGVGTSSFKMTGGSLTAAAGPLFFITNTHAIVELTGVTLKKSGDTLISAGIARWGKSGSNGGTVDFTARNQVLEGKVIADSISKVNLKLMEGSSFKGSMENGTLTMDSTSTWELTGDSRLSSLTEVSAAAGSPETALGNIKSKGFTITYDPTLDANAWLGGKTWNLDGGGKLAPR